MWADSLHLAEQHHLIRLFVWSEASLLVGGILLALTFWRRIPSPLIRHFAIQTAAWGGVSLVIAFLAWRNLGLRDHAAAVRLDRLVWLNLGLDAGYVAVGATLVFCGWYGARKMGLVGAGLAVMIQGVALGALDWVLAQGIAR